VAAGAAAAAAAVSAHRSPQHEAVFSAPATVPARAAAATPSAPAAPAPTTTLPTPPEPGTSTANGRFTWPANANGWTVVLVSYPKLTGREAARATAARAARGLSRVGILDSSLYASLQPGYFVVFTGVYPSQSAAEAAVPTARQAGFRGAYTRQIAG
jgi:hypothetical protein